MNKWLNYDLHMHSYASHLVDGIGKVKRMTAKEFLDTLESKGIDVFSITDHDTFDKDFYEEILNEIDSSNRNIRIIFGAELNVYVRDDDPDAKFHMGIYFQPLKKKMDIISNTIEQLYKDFKKPDLYAILNEFNSKNLKFIIIPEFDKSRGLVKISETLVNSDLMDEFRRYEMQKIFDAYDRGTHFKRDEINEWANAFYKRTKDLDDYLKSFGDDVGAREDFTKTLKQYLKGNIKKDDAPEDVKKYGEIILEYSLEFAFFHFSDWHNGETYEPEYKNMIFGDSNFPLETLEIAVCDPFSRIQCIKYDDTLPVDDNSLREISFSMNDERITIPLTEGLNGIIGKRASGKSLLVSILSKLENSNNTNINKYEKTLNIDKNSISAVKANGTVISNGQLSSVYYLEQSKIKEIYENPDKSSESFASKFPNLPEIEIPNLEQLIQKIDKFSPLDNNYKEFNTYCKQKTVSRSFTFSTINKISTSDFETKTNTLANSFTNYQGTLKEIGFNLSHLEPLVTQLKKTTEFYTKIVSSYNDIIQSVNIKINEFINDASASESVSAQIKQNYNESINIIKKNFDNLLRLKLLEKTIDSFSDLPPQQSKRNIEEGFLFVKEYGYNGPEINSRINSAIESVLKSTKPGTRGVDKSLKGYFYGETSLKDGSTFSQVLKKEFKATSFPTKSTLYRIKNKDLYDGGKEIDELIRNDAIDNISDSSPGDKAAAYLEILLSTNDSILILDQPEDDIDNDYISKTLVPLIRKKKRTKQLIFVTHNPSVAVYADAFNYIFAKNNGMKITYTNRHIENPDDKEEILSILDGGRKSFYNRNMKYGDVIGDLKHED